GLLQTPEVGDVWSALVVVHDPGRGDALMRLLTGPSVNLGAADLLALGEWAAAQARRRTGGDEAAPAEDTVREAAEVASLVEAIDQLPPLGWRDPRGRTLSDAARERLARLAGALRTLRGLGYLSLPELVTTAEHVLGLDIEVLAARPGPAGEARRNLDELTAVAARFSGDAEDSSLGAFLAWLDAAMEEERGLDAVGRGEGGRELAEERRLAYVALTRARRELLLTGSFWRGEAKKPATPSLFLAELLRDGTATVPAGAEWPEASAHDTNPMLEE